MIKLSDIIFSVEAEKIIGNADIQISSVVFDSRLTAKEDVFVAVPGTTVDGHKFIDLCIEQGASAIVCENLPEKINKNVCYIQVKNSSHMLGKMASRYYGNPSSKLKLVGVTGTNGKTTIATLLHRLFIQLGYSCGLLSTIRNKINDSEIKSTHTTPDAVQMNKLISEMVEAGCEYCFMEVSSHSIDQNRIAGLEFKGGIFTNLTHDHLDYHKTVENYLKAKKRFFDELDQSAFALSNLDDKNGRVMMQNTNARQYTYALKGMADFKTKILESHFDGTLLVIDGAEIWTKFIGPFNASNLTAVYGAAMLLEQDKEEVLRALSKIDSVDGRFENIRSNDGITAIVDYAHTPDALLNVLKTINSIRSGEEQLITVVGAGGNRDKTKRPIMAKVAAELSTKVILTSDNPRNEKPDEIIEDMKKGLDILLEKKVITIIDRKEAIKTATMLAKSGDIILVAGKGHETYQEVNGVRSHFDDKEIINECFKK